MYQKQHPVFYQKITSCVWQTTFKNEENPVLVVKKRWRLSTLIVHSFFKEEDTTAR